MRIAITAVTLSLTLFGLAGCGKPVAPWGKVSGVITQDGKPVEPALVLFSNREKGIEMTAETDAEGRFTVRTDKVDGLPVGTYRVAVTPRPTNLPVPEQGMMFKGPAPAASSRIPSVYQDVATTPLSATVVEGENTFSLEIKP